MTRERERENDSEAETDRQTEADRQTDRDGEREGERCAHSQNNQSNFTMQIVLHYPDPYYSTLCPSTFTQAIVGRKSISQTVTNLYYSNQTLSVTTTLHF